MLKEVGVGERQKERKQGNGTEREGDEKKERSKRIHLSLRNGNISNEVSFVPVLPSAGVICACLRGFDD